MDAVSTQGLPSQSNIQRVVTKDGLLIIVSLIESDAFAVSEIDGRNNIDGFSLL